MGEFTEFAEALLDQISVEIDEDSEFPNEFIELEKFSKEILPDISKKVEEFTGFSVKSNLRIEFPDLK